MLQARDSVCKISEARKSVRKVGVRDGDSEVKGPDSWIFLISWAIMLALW